MFESRANDASLTPGFLPISPQLGLLPQIQKHKYINTNNTQIDNDESLTPGFFPISPQSCCHLGPDSSSGKV